MTRTGNTGEGRKKDLMLLVAGPALGLIYAMFLPAIGIVMALYIVGAKIVEAVTGHAVKSATFDWAPSAAYLTGKEEKKAEKKAEEGKEDAKR